MKNKIRMFLSLCLCLACSFSFVACFKSQKDDNISQVEKTMFVLETDNYFAQFYCGEREIDFEYNGKSTDNVCFGILKISTVKYYNSNTMNVILTIDKNENEYVLNKNPFDASYMIDVGFEVKNDAVVCLRVNGIDEISQALSCISSSFSFGYEKCLDIGKNEVADFIANAENNDLTYEIFLTMFFEGNAEEKQYFYSYMIFDNNYNKLTAIISTKTGEVIAKS